LAAATVRRNSPIAAARATAAVLATGEASVIAVVLAIAEALVIAGIGPQPFRPAVIAATGATTRSIAAELPIVIGPPPIDSAAPLAATRWQIDRQAPGNS
jgi:hypothetical protein